MKYVLKSLFVIMVFGISNVNSQTIADGLKYMENENYTEAQKVFDGLIVKEPKNALPHYYLGQLKYLLEDYKGAEMSYNNGLKINNKCFECTISLAKLKLDNGQEAEATKILDAIAKSNKKSAPIHALIGEAFLSSKKPIAAKAIEYFTKSRDLDPKIASTWSRMGDAFKLSGDLGSAMNAYETAVEKDKNNIEAYMSMAKIWANSRQADLGVEKLESVIKLSPDYAPAYKMLYELYISLRKFDKVVPILDKYVSLSGNDIKAKGRLVKFLSFQAKDHERAIIEGEKLKKEFTPAAGNKEDEKFYTINRWMASSYLELEKYQESFDASKDLFDQIAQDTSRKSYESDYENMAKAALKLKKFDEASKLYEDVIKINSSKAEEIYGNFAKGYYDEKNYSKAIEFYLKKNGVKTLGVSDLFYLANCYYAQKDYVNSEKHYAKLIELSPSYVNAYYQRARSLENQDITEPKQYLASNAYSEVIRVASGEKEKNKRFLIDAYVYLAEKSVKDNDYQGAKSYYEMVLAIDPSNQTASQNISIINGGK